MLLSSYTLFNRSQEGSLLSIEDEKRNDSLEAKGLGSVPKILGLVALFRFWQLASSELTSLLKGKKLSDERL